MHFFGGLISFCLVGVILSSSWSASATQVATTTTLGSTPWPMFRHDLLHTGRSPYLGAQAPHLKWSFSAGEDVQSAPAVDSNGNVYVQSHSGYLYALDSSGVLKWRFLTSDSTAFPGLFRPPESSPAIDSNGVIYVGSHDGGLYAIFSNGTLNWRFATAGPVWSSPAVGRDGTIYVGSNDDNLYALSQNGSLKWKFVTGGVVISSPTIDSMGIIYVGSGDGSLYAIYPSGVLKWSFKTGGVFISSSPAIGFGGDRIYIVSGDDNLYAINRNGFLKWKLALSLPRGERSECNGLPGVFASPAIGPHGTVYVGSGCGFFDAVNPSGKLDWRITLDGLVYSSAAIGSDGTIYFGAVALNPDGTLKWSLVTWVECSSPSIAPDGTIYIGTVEVDGGKLLAIS